MGHGMMRSDTILVRLGKALGGLLRCRRLAVFVHMQCYDIALGVIYYRQEAVRRFMLHDSWYAARLYRRTSSRQEQQTAARTRARTDCPAKVPGGIAEVVRVGFRFVMGRERRKDLHPRGIRGL